MTDPRYKLLAFVCEGGVRHPHTATEGFITVGAMLTARPANCRWAVAQTEQLDYIVIDLFDLRSRSRGRMLMPAYSVGENKRFSDVDAAMMAAHMS